MFASGSLAAHFLRGASGIGAFAAAVLLCFAHSWALLLLAVGLVAMRGCPTCRTIGEVD